MKHSTIQPSELRKLFDYDANTGWLTWKTKISNKVLIGKRAGWTYRDPQKDRTSRMVKVRNRNFEEHRVIWAWFYGEWPNGILDHRDRNAENNRIDNLRDCNYSQNTMNSKKRNDNTSGYKGVSWCRRMRKFVANISLNGKRTTIGYFITAKEAGEAYAKIASEMHGEFANLELN